MEREPVFRPRHRKTYWCILISTLLFCASVPTFSQVKSPIGTKKVGDFYVDTKEILNIHWLEYMYYVSQELDSADQHLIYPDSANFWYNLPEYRHGPIVFITYDQAKEYCRWRSDIVNQKYNTDYHYRLPTEKEWRLIANRMLETREKAIGKALIKTRKEIVIEDNRPFHYFRNEVEEDHYDLFWNVSEMVEEKGIAMGLNNLNLGNAQVEDLIKKQKYNGPNAYLGFRCIVKAHSSN